MRQSLPSTASESTSSGHVVTTVVQLVKTTSCIVGTILYSCGTCHKIHYVICSAQNLVVHQRDTPRHMYICRYCKTHNLIELQAIIFQKVLGIINLDVCS